MITVNANGNTTAKGSDTFTYGQANRLKTATVSGTTETYVYDGDGVRFSRQIGTGTPVRYVTDISRSLPVTLTTARVRTSEPYIGGEACPVQ